jgi:hypothetical protein
MQADYPELGWFTPLNNSCFGGRCLRNQHERAMKGYILTIACAGFLAGCADEGRYNRDIQGYGASLTMNGGSGARGVYPDAALYANRFTTTNEYAASIMAPLSSGTAAMGAAAVDRGQIAGTGSIDIVNPYAPTIELVVPSGFGVSPEQSAFAPTIELIVPDGFGADAAQPSAPAVEISTPPATEIPGPPQVPVPAPAPAPPQIEQQSVPLPTPVFKGPGKPL